MSPAQIAWACWEIARTVLNLVARFSLWMMSFGMIYEPELIPYTPPPPSPVSEEELRLRSRHVMERYLGRKLRDDEIVRHRNGDKLDDRIENLLFDEPALDELEEGDG